MTTHTLASAAGASARAKDKGPTVAAVAHQASDQNPSTDSRGLARSGQALRGFCRVLAKALGVQHG